MSDDKARVADVKAAVTGSIMNHPGADAYGVSVKAFEQLYQRRYVGKVDRAELERIMYHARRMLAGDTPGKRGGKRSGSGWKPIAHDRHVRMARMQDDGMSLSQIAAEMNVTPSAVSKAIKRLKDAQEVGE